MINALLATVIIFLSTIAYSAECIVIKNDKSGAGFFNGVSVEKDKAPIAATMLSKRIGKQVELYYNHTEGLIPDLIEAFDQRMTEGRACAANSADMTCGSPLELVDHYELMSPYFQRQVAGNQNATKALELFNRDVIAIESRYAAAPITKKDYAEHERILRQQLKSNAKVVLFAHSQGNLFANRLYETLDQARQKQVALIHVAPASIKLHGDYVLSDEDVVILSLPLSRPPTADVPFSIFHPSGHGFTEVYLNPDLETSRQVDHLYAREVTQRRGMTGFYSRQSRTPDGRFATVGWAQLDGDRGYWGNYSNTCRGTMELLPENDQDQAGDNIMIWLTQADTAGLCQQSNGMTRIELKNQARLPFIWVSNTREGLSSRGMLTCAEPDPQIISMLPATGLPTKTNLVPNIQNEINVELNGFLKSLPALLVK